MGRRTKLSSLEIELASSILYYDKEEMERFFQIYDSISMDKNIIIDGTFDLFASYIRRFKNFDPDPKKRKQNLINEITLRNNNNPDLTIRESFEIWFEKVLETNVPFELADDILAHFIWNDFKNAIDLIDKTDIPFSEKLQLRPKVPKALSNDKLIFLDNEDEEEEESEFVSYTTGLEELDHVVEMTNGNFVVIAARPGVGKSLLMLHMAISNAKKGVKVLYLSFEMNKKQVKERIINNIAGENLKNQYKDEEGRLNVKEYNKAKKVVTDSKQYKPIKDNMQLYVSESSSADSILTEIEDMINEHHYQAIFLDYLQLLRFIRMDEWASIRALTNALKNLAFRKNVLIVTASQVSRSSVEKGLSLTELFGGSSIEADSDIILGIELLRERRQGEKVLANIKVMKDREGDLADLKHIIDYSSGRMYYQDN